MRIQADNEAELADAIMCHHVDGWRAINLGRDTDGTYWAELTRDIPQDHPAVSAAAVELRKLGVSYETAKPILRRVFNAGKDDRA